MRFPRLSSVTGEACGISVVNDRFMRNEWREGEGGKRGWGGYSDASRSDER